ncbi:uncharacterized protein LOC120924295 [Rana temporaria]|uniref:uncharacterized protein LOC120924295 n=1 Tax=Rana temporaria TaxID=8407 RepID=UPI001AAD97F9|nr:uncharacterized protein LOC120924295 [Rana temporaria]
MAENNIWKPKLGTFIGLLGIEYNYVLGQFLSLEDVASIFSANNENHKRIAVTLKKVESHHYEHMQVPIPVYSVKHVATKTDLEGIWGEDGFRTISNKEREKPPWIIEERPEFQDLLYWSADISSEDLEKARQQAYEKVSKVVDPKDPRMFSGELREQFGNSPAFRESVSRYGNFKFSFPLHDLLSWYKDQHCGGGEPQMRILGTELYKLEIAHYIVVHSPDTDKFNDFTEVPTVQGSSDPLPFVYRMDGTLYWRPESTTIPLKVMVSKDGVVRKECYQPCAFFKNDGTCFHTDDGTYGVWNHLILAFHLPNGHLKIPKELLIQNLTACKRDDIYLKKECLPREEAEEVIQELKEEVPKQPMFITDQVEG